MITGQPLPDVVGVDDDETAEQRQKADDRRQQRPAGEEIVGHLAHVCLIDERGGADRQQRAGPINRARKSDVSIDSPPAKCFDSNAGTVRPAFETRQAVHGRLRTTC